MVSQDFNRKSVMKREILWGNFAKNMSRRLQIKFPNKRRAKFDVVNQIGNKFLSLVKNAASFDNLTATSVQQLLNQIKISEKMVDEKAEKIQNMVLTYQFVGSIHKEVYIK